MQRLSRRAALAALAAGGAGCATAAPQSATPTPVALDRRLVSLSRIVGSWRGTAEGEPGKGTVTRTYMPILAGKFVEERNESRYDSGEVHHHQGYWSFDRARSRFILRQFHVESFVNQYIAAAPDFADGVLVMNSEAIENIPAGFRARETYRFNGADAFEEIFEIAEPNADFTRYSHNRFTRV